MKTLTGRQIQSAVTDIPATKSAPKTRISIIHIRLAANQRNPFMRQIQNPQDPKEATVIKFRSRFAVRLG